MKSQIETIDEMRREQLLGPISGWAMLWGNYFVFILFLIMGLSASLISYQYTIPGSAELKQSGIKYAADKKQENMALFFTVRERDHSSIKIGQELVVDLNFPGHHFNSNPLTVRVNSILFVNHIPQYQAIPVDDIKFLSTRYKGQVKITIKNTTLLKRILNR